MNGQMNWGKKYITCAENLFNFQMFLTMLIFCQLKWKSVQLSSIHTLCGERQKFYLKNRSQIEWNKGTKYLIWRKQKQSKHDDRSLLMRCVQKLNRILCHIRSVGSKVNYKHKLREFLQDQHENAHWTKNWEFFVLILRSTTKESQSQNLFEKTLTPS